MPPAIPMPSPSPSHSILVDTDEGNASAVCGGGVCFVAAWYATPATAIAAAIFRYMLDFAPSLAPAPATVGSTGFPMANEC